jgi:Mg2+/citrate symporter
MTNSRKFHMAFVSRFGLTQPLMGACLVMALSGGSALAQSETSLAVSALPVASVINAAGVSAGSALTGSTAVVALPLALTVSGATLVLKAVEVTVRGTVWVLERASDGARVSIELGGRAVNTASTVVGATVVVGVLSTGVILSAANQILCFIPNELGRALLHNERVTP